MTRHASHSHISRQSSLDYSIGARLRAPHRLVSACACGDLCHQCCGRHFHFSCDCVLTPRWPPIAAASRCSGRIWRLASLFSVPPLFLWSASRLIPYVRQAVTFSRSPPVGCIVHVFVMLIVVLRLRPGFRQLRTLYPLCLSLTPVMPWMLSLQNDK